MRGQLIEEQAKRHIGEIGPGHVFGQNALQGAKAASDDDENRTITAMTDSFLLQMARRDFSSVLKLEEKTAVWLGGAKQKQKDNEINSPTAQAARLASRRSFRNRKR